MLIRGSFRGRDNEDMFAIFDGHGSRRSSVHCARHFADILIKHLDRPDSDPSTCLRDAFLEINTQMTDHFQHGTTAVVALLINNRLYVANVGDSRAVLCRNNAAVRLSVDHTTELAEERARVEALGGFIRNGRVQGVIQVTRALGDVAVQPYVSAEPYISVTDMTDDDTILILACDGLFDIFTDQVAVQIARANPDPVVASKKLVDQAYISGSTDNISCLVVRLRPADDARLNATSSSTTTPWVLSAVPMASSTDIALPPTDAPPPPPPSALPPHMRQKKPIISTSAPTAPAAIANTSDIVEI
jgi:protein phosphatase PTC1